MITSTLLRTFRGKAYYIDQKKRCNGTFSYSWAKMSVELL